MWRRVRQYTCSICGIKDVGEIEYWGLGDKTYDLPKGWKGSATKHGSCICKDCFSTMQKLKKHNSTTFDDEVKQRFIDMKKIHGVNSSLRKMKENLEK